MGVCSCTGVVRCRMVSKLEVEVNLKVVSGFGEFDLCPSVEFEGAQPKLYFKAVDLW